MPHVSERGEEELLKYLMLENRLTLPVSLRSKLPQREINSQVLQ